jgi:signal peptidase II
MIETKTQNSDILQYSSQRRFKRPSPAISCLKANMVFWLLAVGGLSLDLWSKGAVFNWLENQPNHEFSVIDGFLQLRLVSNDGAAWGLMGGKGYFLSVVSIFAITAILVIFLISGRRQTFIHIALAFLAAGVSGNLYDRVFNGGKVRDFIEVYYKNFQWPVFNVADALLCIGVGLLIISNLLIDKPDQTHVQPQK